jgi:hypothetical protein
MVEAVNYSAYSLECRVVINSEKIIEATRSFEVMKHGLSRGHVDSLTLPSSKAADVEVFARCILGIVPA